MKRKTSLCLLTLFCLLLLSSLSDALAQAPLKIITFASDSSWTVSQAGVSLGEAQPVCLNAASPANCPPNAIIWGFPGAWGADASNLAGAKWIWVPGLTGASAPAYPAEYTFSKKFVLKGLLQSATISIAADDFAEVRVNDFVVGTIGSTTDMTLGLQSHSALHSFNLLPYLIQGTNIISIRADNGNFGCGSGAYSCNPAGLVFGGVIQIQRTER